MSLAISSPSPRTADLVVRMMPQVRRIAYQLARRLPRHIAVDDLIAAGHLGLVCACANFDPARGEAFAGYAETRIRGAMLDELRSADALSRDQRAFANQVVAARGELGQHLAREPSGDDIAAHLGMPLAEYWTRSADTFRGSTVELDTDRDESMDVRDARQALADDRLAEEEAKRAAVAALSALPPRLRMIVGLYYTEELTLRQIGDRLGVSESRACQLLSEATRRARALCAPDAAARRPKHARPSPRRAASAPAMPAFQTLAVLPRAA